MGEENSPKLGEGKTCLVIGPIGSPLDPVGTAGRVTYENSIQMWEEVFIPAGEHFGLNLVRADKISQPGDIPEQIFVLLRDAEVVIADVTGGNPNVMYELGLRHAKHHAVTVQIGEYQQLPFDVNTIRTVQFKRTEAGRIEARTRLIESLEAGLKGEGTPVTATRIWNEQSSGDSNVVADALAKTAEPEPGEEIEAPGTIEILAEGEEAVGLLADTIKSMGAALTDVGHLSREATVRLNESDRQKRGFAGRLIIAKELARDLEGPATELEGYAQEFVDHIDSADAMVGYILDRVANNEEDFEQLGSFFEHLSTMAKSAEGSSVPVGTMINQVRGFKKMARDLHGPGRTIESALNRYLQGVGVLSDWNTRAQQIADDHRSSD